MIFVKTETLSQSLQRDLLDAWNNEYPSVLHHNLTSFQQYIKSLVNLHHTIVIDEDNRFCAWYFDFDRDDERQFGIIVHKKFQNKGLGKELIAKAKLTNDHLSAWVVNSNAFAKKDGSPYISPLNFYLQNGFSIEPTRWDSEKIKTVKITWHK